MVNQMDVARRAGVGRRTVSNVVTGFPYVSDDVRRRVLAAIDELGYVPNRTAQRLRTGTSGFVALLVPEVSAGYFGEVSDLIIEEAATRDLGTVVAQTHGKRERELAEIERILATQPDGIIVSPLGLSETDLTRIHHRCPIALIGEHLTNSKINSTAIDNERAAYEMVSHLLSTGRRNIGFVGSQADEHRFVTLRRSGYRRALRTARAPRTLELQTRGFHHRDGAQAGEQVARHYRLGNPIDAIVCATDGLAIGLMRALRDANIAVPHEIAVSGFDDIVEGRYSTPRLTTIAPNKHQIAREAIEAVTENRTLDGRPIDHELLVRESTV